jgi:hypothetical protein
MNFKLSDDLEQNICLLMGIMDGGMGYTAVKIVYQQCNSSVTTV